MKDERNEVVQTEVLRQLQANLAVRQTQSIDAKPSTRNRRKVELLALPTDLPLKSAPALPTVIVRPLSAPKQLALF